MSSKENKSWGDILSEYSNLFKTIDEKPKYTLINLIDVCEAHGLENDAFTKTVIQSLINGESPFKIIENLLVLKQITDNNLLKISRTTIDIANFKNLKTSVQTEILEGFGIKSFVAKTEINDIRQLILSGKISNDELLEKLEILSNEYK